MNYFDKYIGPAESGNPDSQWQVGMYYCMGDGVVKDQKLAVSWWRKAAEQGHILAMTSLAGAYSLGQGVEIDEAEAAKWYMRAADKGDTYSQYKIGCALVCDDDVNKNYELGVEYLRKAALSGDKQAIQFLKGLAAHFSDIGIKPDPRLEVPRKAGCLLFVIGSGIFGLLYFLYSSELV